MRTFKEFLKILKEMEGDFGSPAPKIKPNCYGRKVRYAMLPGKKVCAFKRRR